MVDKLRFSERSPEIASWTLSPEPSRAFEAQTTSSLLWKVCFLAGVSAALQTQNQPSSISLAGNHTLLCYFLRTHVHVRACVGLRPIHRLLCVGVCQRCCLQAGCHCVAPY